jgi:nucleotide-binding universal stress UspA family protein
MFSKIVVGTDGSPTSLEAVRQAATLASQGGGTLHVACAMRDATDLAVLPDMAAAMPIAGMAESLQQQATTALERAVTVAKDVGCEVETHVERGEASTALVRLAEDVGADLIVVGNKGMSGAARFLLGSVPNRVAHHAPCSVLIVQTTAKG